MKLTFSQHNDLKDCRQETLVLNQKMSDTLVGIIKSASENKIIRTDKPKVKDFQDNTILRSQTIYAYKFYPNINKFVEEKVSAVAVFENKTIGILLCGDVEFGEDVTDEVLLESSDWHTIDIYGGVIFTNSTLYNICINIDDYL